MDFRKFNEWSDSIYGAENPEALKNGPKEFFQDRGSAGDAESRCGAEEILSVVS
jgi:hypothetical protein